MRKKASWKSELPTLFGAAYGVYFGFSGGAYAGSPGILETTYSLFSAGFGVANLCVVITSIILMRTMRAHEKVRAQVDRYEALIAEREAADRAPA
ncbi:hypothetical protein [Duganella sp. LjRoot269]|uniref:hypothetical protein n=1 Tax=Duganella sp. LjRoot269 TaxID=3342305 RepID=UPI003ED0A6FC